MLSLSRSFKKNKCKKKQQQKKQNSLNFQLEEFQVAFLDTFQSQSSGASRNLGSAFREQG